MKRCRIRRKPMDPFVRQLRNEYLATHKLCEVCDNLLSQHVHEIIYGRGRRVQAEWNWAAVCGRCHPELVHGVDALKIRDYLIGRKVERGEWDFDAAQRAAGHALVPFTVPYVRMV